MVEELVTLRPEKVEANGQEVCADSENAHRPRPERASGSRTARVIQGW